jgi:maleate isomerase
VSRSSFEPRPGSLSIVGALSGKEIQLPDVNAAPMPSLAGTGVIHDGEPAPDFGTIDSTRAYPDVRSFRRKFGLLIPATNTSMEHELWSIIGSNPGPVGLDGVGIHTSNVLTPVPRFGDAKELLAYKQQFLSGLKEAVDQVLMAQPQYLVMGMSLEHILTGIDDVRASVIDVEAHSGLAMATWHDAALAALTKLDARRIGLLTPFDRTGNDNAKRMFEDLGFNVVSTVGFSCEHAMHIAHVPDWAKEKAIMELLATPANRLDAVVQCGTNMSLIQVSERLEPVLGIPVVGINAATFWYALRENGFTHPLQGAGMLLREF